QMQVAAADLDAVRALKVDHAGFRESVGVEPTTGDDDALFHERLMLRPAFNVSGFASGYTGPGQKTIIYKEALAKADVRLVGGQDPRAVFAAMRRFAADRGYANIEIRCLKSTPPSRTPLDHRFVAAVKESVAQGFGREPLVVPSLDRRAARALRREQPRAQREHQGVALSRRHPFRPAPHRKVGDGPLFP